MKTGDLVRGRLDGYTNPHTTVDSEDTLPIDTDWHEGILVIQTYHKMTWIGTIYVLANDGSWLDPATIEVITPRGEPGADTGGWRDEPNDQRIERILEEYGGR